MQIETGTGCHFSPARLAMIKMIDILLSWQRYGEQELVHCWWVQKKFFVEYSFKRKHSLGLSIKIKNVYSLTQQFYFREFAAFLAPRKVLGTKKALDKYSLSKLINEFILPMYSHISSKISSQGYLSQCCSETARDMEKTKCI